MDYSIWLADAEKQGRLEAQEPQGSHHPGANRLLPDHLEVCPGSDQEATASSKWLALPTIQYPVQDWAPVIQEMKEVDAGAIMVDHWVAAEYAAFCKQFVANPVPNSLVYLQYGPSQPEFLTLAGELPRTAFAGARSRASMATRTGRLSAQNTRSGSPASWAWSTPASRTTLPISQAAWEGRRRSQQVQGGVRLGPRQSHRGRLRLHGHEQSVPGGAALPR